MLSKILEMVSRKRQAYRMVFRPDGNRNTVAADIVLADLRQFCRGTSTPAAIGGNGVIDPIATGIAIGRQEVWHRIVSNLHLTDADIYRLVEKDGT